MKYGLVILSLAIAIFMVSDFNSRLTDLNRLKAEKEIIATRLETLIETKTALEYKITYAKSDSAVMEWAYENHLVMPGDLRVVPIAITLDKPMSTPSPVVVAFEENNLERWLSLFIDPIPASPSP